MQLLLTLVCILSVSFACHAMEEMSVENESEIADIENRIDVLLSKECEKISPAEQKAVDMLIKQGYVEDSAMSDADVTDFTMLYERWNTCSDQQKNKNKWCDWVVSALQRAPKKIVDTLLAGKTKEQIVACDSSKKRLLNVACGRAASLPASNLSFVTDLINAGLSIEASDENNWLPINIAARGSNHRLVQLLVEHGARFDKADSLGTLPISYTVSNHMSQTLLALQIAQQSRDTQKQFSEMQQQLADTKQELAQVKTELALHTATFAQMNEAVASFHKLLLSKLDQGEGMQATEQER